MLCHQNLNLVAMGTKFDLRKVLKVGGFAASTEELLASEGYAPTLPNPPGVEVIYTPLSEQ